MSSYEANKCITMLAGSDFTGDLFKLVEVSAAGTVDLTNATTDAAVGVIGEEVTAGLPTKITLLQGIVKVKLGGTVTVGQLLIPTAAGLVTGVAGIANIPANSMSVGIATKGGAINEVGEMLAMPLSSPAAS